LVPLSRYSRPIKRKHRLTLTMTMLRRRLWHWLARTITKATRTIAKDGK
jgi:hypothetical protein